MKICNCGSEIPQKRLDLGYSTCVGCSTTKKFSGHLVVHHKTGNEYEVIRDPETAREVKRMTRAGFGARRKGGNHAEKVPTVTRKIKATAPQETVQILKKVSPDPSKWRDEEGGSQVAKALETSKEEAIRLLEKIYSSGEMSPDCRKRLLHLIQHS